MEEFTIEQEKKKTEIDYFHQIKDLIVEIGADDDLIHFIDNKIGQIERKHEGSVERSIRNKLKNNDMADDIYRLMSNTRPMTIDEIVNALNMRVEWEDRVTRNMVSPRLNILVEQGRVKKEMVRINKMRRYIYTKITNEKKQQPYEEEFFEYSDSDFI